MFDKAKKLYGLQKQARTIRKELKNIHIEAEVEGVIVVIDGEQEVIKVALSAIPGLPALPSLPGLPALEINLQKLSENLVKAFNKAIKKSQQIAAEKMKPIMGSMKMDELG